MASLSVFLVPCRVVPTSKDAAAYLEEMVGHILHPDSEKDLVTDGVVIFTP